MSTVRNAEHWRAKEEEARRRASTMRDEDAKQAMLQVAAGYAHLAALAERREAENDPFRSN
jgi:hypothetical protein